MRTQKTKMLNVRFEENTYTEFSAASEMLGSRSIAAYIHTVVFLLSGA